MATTPTAILPQTFNFHNYLPASVKCGIHWMPWFGGKDHIDVGYSSDDPAVITRQCDRFQSLGCADFVCEEYYGHMFAANKPYYQRASVRMFAECERRQMPFCLCPASAYMTAYGAAATDAAATTAATIDLLNYAYYTYFQSPLYLRDGGQPIVMWFGIEGYAINWTQVKAQHKGNCKFLFRNAGGFTYPDPPGVSVSDGAFDWPSPWMTNDPNANILDPKLAPHFDFWRAAAANPAKVAIGVLYAGFNDATSTWRPKDAAGNMVTRQLARRNGVTLLDSISIVPPTAKYVQVCTFNDHEEGTGVEFTLDQDYSGKYVAA